MSQVDQASGARAIAADPRPEHVQPAPELSIVVPTYNARNNVALLVERLKTALADMSWEVLIVDDDSPDGTSALAKQIAASDARVRCLRRVGRRGVSSACLDGVLASQARYVAVMEGDLQNDENLLGAMLDLLRRDAADLVVATRSSASIQAAAGLPQQSWGSGLAHDVIRRIQGLKLKDPMSGYFMVRRDLVEQIASKLSTQELSLLLDIVMTAGHTLRVVELSDPPLPRSNRRRSRSLTFSYLGLLFAKASGDLIPFRFVLFCIVGSIGVVVHFAVLSFSLSALGLAFVWSQTMATVIAIANNFTINNALTYRDHRLTGLSFLGGLLRFYIVSAIGLVANVGVSNWMFSNQQTWWVAGLAGVFIGVAWNYVVTSIFVWRAR